MDKSTTKDVYYTISIDLDAANQRFDRFLRKFYKPYTTVTLTMIYSWIRKGYIRLNNKKGKEDDKIVIGDTISINISKTIALTSDKDKQRNDTLSATEELSMIEGHITYEDTNRLVFNKPPRMLMHPGSGSAQKAITMNDRLYSYLNKKNQITNDRIITQGSTFKPAFCFRLDKDTSGVLIAAKEYHALQHLNALIKNREVTKRYIVAVSGNLPNFLDINKPLFKGYHGEKQRAHMFVNYEKGLSARTHVYKITSMQDKELGPISLGLVRLMTGRMHQIRAHLLSEGFPILGDKDYGNEALTRKITKTHNVQRQLLHSFSYSFIDKERRKQTFTAPIPSDIQNLFPKITASEIEIKITSLLYSKS